MNDKKKRIYRILKNSDYPMFPKEISSITEISHSTTKVYLRQMINDNQIIQNDVGLYLTPEHIVKENGAVYPPLSLHGVNLHFKYNPNTPPPFLMPASSVTFATRKHKINKAIVEDCYFDDRKITITFHLNTGLVIIQSLAGSNPYDFESFRRFCAWVNGRFPNIDNLQWIVKMIGINWDDRSLRLDGLNEITLQNFENMWIKLYQKTKDMVRIETHAVLDIKLSDAIDILLDLDNMIEMRKIARR